MRWANNSSLRSECHLSPTGSIARSLAKYRRQVQGRSIRSLLFGLALPVAVSAQIQPQTQLTFAELEILSARIGEVRTVTGEIFDTADPKEDKWLFRLANAMHIRTRPAVIERALLFKTGDLLSVAVIEETERLLRRNRYLYDVQILPLAYHDGVVDIEVRTRDTWSLDLGFSAGRAGGRQFERHTAEGIQPSRLRDRAQLRTIQQRR